MCTELHRREGQIMEQGFELEQLRATVAQQAKQIENLKHELTKYALP